MKPNAQRWGVGLMLGWIAFAFLHQGWGQWENPNPTPGETRVAIMADTNGVVKGFTNVTFDGIGATQINLGGTIRTNWPAEAGDTLWVTNATGIEYTAGDVTMLTITGVNQITLGGETRTNWPEGLWTKEADGSATYTNHVNVSGTNMLRLGYGSTANLPTQTPLIEFLTGASYTPDRLWRLRNFGTSNLDWWYDGGSVSASSTMSWRHKDRVNSVVEIVVGDDDEGSVGLDVGAGILTVGNRDSSVGRGPYATVAGRSLTSTHSLRLLGRVDSQNRGGDGWNTGGIILWGVDADNTATNQGTVEIWAGASTDSFMTNHVNNGSIIFRTEQNPTGAYGTNGDGSDRGDIVYMINRDGSHDFFGNTATNMGDVESTGTVTAAAFVGDGSGLTGLPASHDPVTLAGTPDYLTLSGQQITLGLVDLATDVSGVLALTDLAQGGATSNQVIKWNGSAWAPAADEASGVWTNLAAGTGIGYDAPATGAEVALDLQTEDGTAFRVTGNGTTTTLGNLTVGSIIATAGNGVQLASAYLRGGSSGSFTIQTRLDQDLILGTGIFQSNVEALRIKPTGYIGIGTNAPAVQVHATETIRADEGFSYGATPGINVTNSWVDANTVTNTQVFLGGILTSWTQEGP
jgi:hypothetical protein